MTPRPRIAPIPASAHGGDFVAEARAAGIEPADVLDFSVNVAPFGPSPFAVAASRRTPLDRYPAQGAPALRRLLAERHDLAEDRVLVTAGATEALGLIGSAYLDGARTALVLGPTYGEYARTSRIAGARVVTWTASASDEFDHQIGRTLSRVEALAPDVLFLCNPNNPTGRLADKSVVEALLGRLPSTLVVLDEAYMPFVRDGCWSGACLTRRPNLVVCRSLTKDYALAGLRVGYVLGHPDVVAALRTAHAPWTVTAAAEAAAVAAIEDAAHLATSMRLLEEACRFLREGLLALGLRPLPSAAHFFLVRVGDAPAWRRRLLRRRCAVRDCTSFGLPEYLRIAPRSPDDGRVLLEAVAATLRETPRTPETEGAPP